MGSRFGVSCFVLVHLLRFGRLTELNKQPKRTASAFFFWWQGEGRKEQKKNEYMEDWKNKVEDILNSRKNKIAEIDIKNKRIEYSPKIISPKIDDIRGDEEIVRAYLIDKLINELGYTEKNIQLEKEYTQSSIGRDKKIKNTGRADVIVYDKLKNPFLFIEVKAPDKYDCDLSEIEGQLFNLSDEEEKQNKTTVKYLVYYSIDKDLHDKMIIIDKHAYQSYDEWQKNKLNSKEKELPYNYNKSRRKIRKKDSLDSELFTITKEKLSQLRTKIHDTLWSSGVEDNEAYLFLIKYLLTKIYDEDYTKVGEKYVCQIFDKDYNNEKVFLERINSRYHEALQKKLNYDESDLDTTGRIISTEKIPINSLYFLVELLENYSFTKSLKNSKDDILGAFFEETNREKFKQSKGQFFTTNNIVKFVIYALQLDKLSVASFEENEELPYIIDPSTGSGTFLIEAMKAITLAFRKNEINMSNAVKRSFQRLFPVDKPNEWAEKYIYGIDNNYSLAISTKVNMILHGDGSSNIFKNDGLQSFKNYENLKGSKLAEREIAESHYQKPHGGMLVNERFDVVMSNPPFSVNLTEKKDFYNKFFLFGDKKNSENLFIERYYQLLREGGRLGVVLPESVFDTTENKYIRLFLFKYFKIKAIVSLPQLTFEPYTSTKTSLLFAQKKTKAEVEQWNTLWDKYGSEWGILKTRVVRYYDFFVKGEKLNKRLAWYKELDPNTKSLELEDKHAIELIDKKDKKQILTNIKRFLKDYVTCEDDTLEIKSLLEKYSTEIEELSKYDKETEAFGFYNAWWVFGEVAKELKYDIFMAEAENVGYKRTKRTETPMPNDLFDLEYAPQRLDTKKIIDEYDEQINKINEQIKEYEEKKQEKEKIEKPSKADSNKIKQLEDWIKTSNVKLNELQQNKTSIENVFAKYYANNLLKEEFNDRTDKDLIDVFKTGLLKQYKSEDVLLRNTKEIKILDAIRKEVLWD